MELLEESFLGSDTEQVCYKAGLSLDMLLRYLHCCSRTRRGSTPSRFSALIAAG
jgi:hypothetical protein